MKNILMCVVLIFICPLLMGQTKISMSKEGGIYTMPCEVNGLKLKFIFDTGASDVSISLTEAVFMLKNGYLNEDDLIGSTYYQVANGDIIEGTEINLRQIKIGNQYIYNVKASIVHSLSAPLLLGQSALNKMGKISFDYSNNVLTLGEEASDYQGYSSSEISLFTTTKSDSQLWKQANSLNTIKVISKGTRVRVIEYENSFWKVFVDGMTGYIYDAYINVTYEMASLKSTKSRESIDNNISKSDVGNSSEISLYTTTKTDGQLWKQANPLNTIRAISKGTRVRVIGYENGYWEVFVDGMTGYIYNTFINVTYEMSKMKNK